MAFQGEQVSTACLLCHRKLLKSAAISCCEHWHWQIVLLLLLLLLSLLLLLLLYDCQHYFHFIFTKVRPCGLFTESVFPTPRVFLDLSCLMPKWRFITGASKLDRTHFYANIKDKGSTLASLPHFFFAVHLHNFRTMIEAIYFRQAGEENFVTSLSAELNCIFLVWNFKIFLQ